MERPHNETIVLLPCLKRFKWPCLPPRLPRSMAISSACEGLRPRSGAIGTSEEARCGHPPRGRCNADEGKRSSTAPCVITCRAIRKIRAVHIITAPSIRAACTRLQNAHRIPPPSGLPTQAPNLRTPSLYPLYSLQPPANRAPRPSTLAPVRNLRTASIRPPRAPCTRLQAAHVIPSPSSLHSCFLPPPPLRGPVRMLLIPSLHYSRLHQPSINRTQAVHAFPEPPWLWLPVPMLRTPSLEPPGSNHLWESAAHTLPAFPRLPPPVHAPSLHLPSL